MCQLSRSSTPAHLDGSASLSLYGFVLAALAVFMLTIADDFSRYIASHVLVFLSVLVLPLVLFLIHHQSVVFRALGKRAA